MGFLGLFGKGRLSEKKIDKAAKLACNPFAQSDVRMREMQRLLDDGSERALRALLRRFSATAQGHIADEDEKKWLEDVLVEQGEGALGALKDFISHEQRLTYALRAFRRIAGDEETVRFLLAVLSRYGPEDYRSIEAKQQLVLQLADDLDHAEVLATLGAFLLDHSDDVRWVVMDLFERAATQGPLAEDVLAGALPALAELVTAEDVGPRIQQRAAEMLEKRAWQLPVDVVALSPALEEQFFLDKKHFVRRRAAKSR